MAGRYLRHLKAEEDVHYAVDAMLTEGGRQLWVKILQRKAYPFAGQTITDNLVSHLKMCFVPHDQGSPELVGGEDDGDERWDIEEEPNANRIDSWARMHLQTKKREKPVGRLGATQETTSSSRFGAGRKSMREKGGNNTMKKGDRRKELASKCEKIVEEVAVDEEEDRYREMKEREERRRRDEEARKKVVEREAEEAQRKLDALHEEMKVRQFTYDSQGCSPRNIIWVDPQNTERYPKVSEMCPWGLKGLKERKPPEPPPDEPAPKASRRKTTTKKGKGKKELSERELAEQMGFTDTYTRLPHEQPPIIDTMDVKAGVDLEFQGKQKRGPVIEKPKDQMSRTEYLSMTQNEFSMGFGDDESVAESPSMMEEAAGSLTSAPSELPPLKVAPGQQASAASPAPPKAGGSMAGGQRSRAAGNRAASDLGGSKGSKESMAGASTTGDDWGQVPEFSKDRVVKLPTAPAFNLRGKRGAIGNLGRPPRLHLGPLGTTQGYRFPQPVLGATMGHGLLRSASMKEEFFFPQVTAGPPGSLGGSGGLNRSTSDATLQSSFGRTAPHFGATMPPSTLKPQDQKSAAYRTVRNLLGFGDEFSAYGAPSSPLAPTM